MATVKVILTTSCSQAINYVEPRATVKIGEIVTLIMPKVK